MHSKDLLQMGESMDRILLLSVWREVPIYSEAERAIIELTESATNEAVGSWRTQRRLRSYTQPFR
ncbi:carboxymuconolactone decarboxylase family protein [Kroppenstedtia sanguinis]|uniref:Uncharacterized protein n=1 Tax=Kroppenstedtia sanguinis TaxID=1380684 RepID=A0ABW4CEF8_9BACL